MDSILLELAIRCALSTHLTKSEAPVGGNLLPRSINGALHK